MKQVTAVEWLVEQLSSSKYIYNLMEEIECQSTIVQPNIFHQAKEIEKEQIIDTFQDSRILSITNNCSSGEQYYNETYNKTI
jgi:hypothetical protein